VSGESPLTLTGIRNQSCLHDCGISGVSKFRTLRSSGTRIAVIQTICLVLKPPGESPSNPRRRLVAHIDSLFTPPRRKIFRTPRASQPAVRQRFPSRARSPESLTACRGTNNTLGNLLPLMRVFISGRRNTVCQGGPASFCRAFPYRLGRAARGRETDLLFA